MHNPIKILFTLLLFFIADMCFGQPELVWARSYGGSAADYARSIQQTTDGGYIVTGSTSSKNGNVLENNGGTVAWVIKLDSLGEMQWQKSLGVTFDDYGRAVIQISDGGYIVLGESSRDAWLIKLSSSGQVQWQKNFGSGNFITANAIQQTKDKGYIVAGMRESDAWIIKLDSLGEIQWERSFIGSAYDAANSIQETLDGGYVVAISSQSNDGDFSGNEGKSDVWIFKLSSLGNLLWQRTFGDNRSDVPRSILQLETGDFVLGGYSAYGDSESESKAWIMKLDSVGNERWRKEHSISHYDITSSVHQSQDGGYGIIGSSFSEIGDGASAGNAWIIKLNSEGEKQWQNSIYAGDAAALSGHQTLDGDYILAGVIDSSYYGERDFLIAKLKPIDCGSTGPALSVEEVEHILCAGDRTGKISVLHEGGRGRVRIDWSNGASGVKGQDGLVQGVYTVIATDLNSCKDSVVVEVTAPMAIEIVLDSIISPNDEGEDGAAYISVSGGIGEYTYAWSDESTMQDLTGAGIGMYSVTVIDENDCSETIDVTISNVDCETSNLSFSYTSTPEDCNLDNGTVTIAGSGGAMPYSYGWPNTVSTSNEAMIMNVSEGIFLFTLMDIYGCEVSDTIVVEKDRPLISLSENGITDVTCLGESNGGIDIDVSAGNPPYTFLWSNDDATEDLSEVVTGIYIVTVTDSLGCKSTKTYEVGSPDQELFIEVVTITDATGDNSDGGIDIEVTGGTPPYTYAWQDQVVGVQDLTGVQAGNYKVIVFDANECEAELSATVGMGVGLELLSSLRELSIHPNPTIDIVNIQVKLDRMKDLSLTLHSYDGQILEETEIIRSQEQNFILDLSQYNSGIYFATINVDGEQISRRVSLIK